MVMVGTPIEGGGVATAAVVCEPRAASIAIPPAAAPPMASPMSSHLLRE